MKEKNNKISMVVFDWAGTTVDYGSCAPMDVFKMVFDEAGIYLSRQEINGPMGMEKKAHIRSLLSLENAKKQWQERYGRAWTEEDVNILYERFEEKLREVVADYSKPIDGVVETVEILREQGIKIGSTTGYNNDIMSRVIPAAEKLGYVPDCVITPDITGLGRPTPFMLFECMKQLKVFPVKSVVKVGDTIADILEGKNAGVWSIGLLEGSNLLGLREEEYQNLSEKVLEELKKETTMKYKNAGADIVIDNIKELPAVIERLNQMMEQGE